MLIYIGFIKRISIIFEELHQRRQITMTSGKVYRSQAIIGS